MISEFLASWELFQYSYLEGWLIGLVLSLVGVIVVARDQIFIGAAVAQASTLGIGLALYASTTFPVHSETHGLPHSTTWLCCDTLQPVMAVVFSILAAIITSQAGRVKRESHEAITGWVFLVSASLSVLVVAHSPHGLEEIYRIHSSSIIGATAADVGVFAALLALTVLLLAAAGPRLLLFVTDPSMAAAAGMRLGRWALCESLWLGLVVGFSIRATGMLYTFGGLVLPPLVAKNLCREVRTMFFVAPAVALLTNTIGFVLANHYDFPPAQMVVANACLLLLAAWVSRRFRSECRLSLRGCEESGI
jgi:zinc/manganese transport system permease protein